MLGTIGESKRMDTTVIADSVNLASRLEGLTKIYGARVLISESVTSELVNADDISLRDLGLIAAKGKSKPTRVYEVLDADDDATKAAKLADISPFEHALASFSAGDFAAARDAFAAIAVRCPHDAAVAHYIARSSALLLEPPQDWDGVDHMRLK